MKRKVLAAAAIFGAIAVAGSVYSRSFSSGHGGRPARSYAYAMCVTHGGRPAEERWSEAVLASVARTLRNGERTSLEEALTVSATRWEARANPLLDDLEDVDADGSLEEWFRSAPRFVRTAQAAARLHACAPDGLCAAPRPGASCPPGWTAPANDAEEGRARFIAWPWGHAIRMRAPSETDARRAAVLLRLRIHGSQRIALVLGADDVEVTKGEPFVKLRDVWTRRAGLRSIALDERREADAGDDLDGSLPAPAPHELVLLPRLETIADDRAFEDEVRSIAPKLEPAR